MMLSTHPRRDLAQIADTRHDMLIIGGGASGAFIAWEATLRGYKVALVEAGDFAHATSSGNSRLVHGGLRYLKNFQFGVVRESLKERRYWEARAAHMVHPLEFVVPLGLPDTTSGLGLRTGLTLYDLLSYDRNRLDDPDKHLPGHRMMSKDDVIAAISGLDEQNLSGGISYYDCQMPMPERLAIAALTGAAEAGAMIANHARVTNILHEKGQATGATIRDDQGEYIIRAEIVINATGPWADQLDPDNTGGAVGTGRKLVRSSGIHIVTRDLTRGKALTYLGNKGHFFVIPWRGYSLIGTTDNFYEGAPEDYRVSREEIDGLLTVLAIGLPEANLTRNDVLYAYGALRPLVGDTDSKVANTYKASRKSDLVDHGAENGLSGYYTVLGGKWTTSRDLGEKTVTSIEKSRKLAATTSRSFDTALPGSPAGRLSVFTESCLHKHKDIDPDLLRHLIFLYGDRYERVLEIAGPGKAPAILTHDPEPLIGAQIVYAMRHEMADTLSDILWRRLGLGLTGRPDDGVLRDILAVAATEGNWDKKRQDREMAAYLAPFDRLPLP